MAEAQNTIEKATDKNQDQTLDVNKLQFRLLTRAKFWHFVDTEEALRKEIHENRLENLRKELLIGLKDTEWQYDPISKYIGRL